MEFALNMLDMFPKVSENLVNLIIRLTDASEDLEGQEEYKEVVNFKLGRTVQVTPRGSFRSFKIDGKPTGSIEEAVNMIEFGDFETINLRSAIKSNPELFSFVPISRGKEVRLTISKYSEYLLQYINPNAIDIQVVYTFRTMFVREFTPNGVKAYMFDLGTNGISVNSVLRNYCANPDMNHDPHSKFYIATNKKKQFVTFGSRKANFAAVQSFIKLLRFFETSCFKYILLQDNSLKNKDITTLKSYAVKAAVNYTSLNLESICISQGISVADYYRLVELKEKSITTSSGKEITLDDIIDMLDMPVKLTKDFFKVGNLIKEVQYEEIPN